MRPGIRTFTLSRIPTDLFGLALWRRAQMKRWPNIQRFLAPLPPEDIQSRFAGGKGEALLPRALFFANYLETTAKNYFGKSDIRYLDYGCGWGRIMRFLPRLTPINNITGVDPLEEVRNYLGGEMLAKRFSVINPVPENFEIPGSHDVVYLFSIMTHTPPEVNKKIISAIGQSLSSGGLVLTTIRPRSFWDYTQNFWGGHTKDSLKIKHDTKGCAFMGYSHNENYGDCSYEHEFFVDFFHGFELLHVNYCVVDPFQISYCFRKV